MSGPLAYACSKSPACAVKATKYVASSRISPHLLQGNRPTRVVFSATTAQFSWKLKNEASFSTCTAAHAPTEATNLAHDSLPFAQMSNDAKLDPPLSRMPLHDLLRSYALMSISASPLFLRLSTALLERMIRSKTPLLDVEQNATLNWLVKLFLYRQFCAGENPEEVRNTLQKIRGQGYGVVLEYASEIMGDLGDEKLYSARAAGDIEKWRQGLLGTISITKKGDWVALKWSGMGPLSMHLLRTGKSPSPQMRKAMNDVCNAAFEKGVRLLPAAEPQDANRTVEDWTLDLAKKYNKLVPGRFVIYSTIQCYLKSVYETLEKHVSYAQEHEIPLGFKLVRGAYLASEPRNLIWDTKIQTDNAYDEVVSYLLTNKPAFNSVQVMLATHNSASIDKASRIQEAQINEGQNPVPLSFASLFGMADDISNRLLQVNEYSNAKKGIKPEPKVLKYVSWGSVSECLNFLLRRAAENNDAMTRTTNTALAMRSELIRRFKTSLSK